MAQIELEEANLLSLRSALDCRELSSEELTGWYLERIERLDPQLHSVLALNPEARSEARAKDREAAVGPLHGIPILVKDNIDTSGDMGTTAGSLALTVRPPAQDAPVVRALRAAGAIILGKTNLSEWANFRSEHSLSGWSAVGGLCRNPYVLDRSACGSSSGSAAAVAANLAAAALGSETDGSVVCPSALCGAVGLKPTVGLLSGSGVVPIAPSQDTVGTHGRTVHDAALLLEVLAPAPGGYSSACRDDGLQGKRLGAVRRGLTGYSPPADRVFEEALERMRRAGAEVVDPADLDTLDQMAEPELTVLLYEFKAALAAYLATRRIPQLQSLQDLIRFNDEHAVEEMAWFGQDLLLRSEQKGGLDEQEYRDARAKCLRLSRDEGIDKVLEAHQLDALVAPTASPAWVIDPVNADPDAGDASTPAALAGYPLITVPAGYAAGELPVGLCFIGRAYSETRLIACARGFEAAAGARRPPRLLPTLPAPDGPAG